MREQIESEVFGLALHALAQGHARAIVRERCVKVLLRYFHDWRAFVVADRIMEGLT